MNAIVGACKKRAPRHQHHKQKQMKKTAALLALISLIGLAGAYQENFTTSDSLDFLGNVFGGWGIDMLSNSLGWVAVLLLLGLCVLGVLSLYYFTKWIMGLRG